MGVLEAAVELFKDTRCATVTVVQGHVHGSKLVMCHTTAGRDAMLRHAYCAMLTLPTSCDQP